MAVSSADRQRRYRAHKRGDHTLCDPARCGTVTSPAVTVTRNAALGGAGKRLWRDLEGPRLSGARRDLALEACRIVDRLERLDDFLRGREDAWLKFHARNEDGSIVEVVVDKALAEARQQAIALKQIVSELRQSAPAKPQTGGSVLDQLAARRANRLANTAG